MQPYETVAEDILTMLRPFSVSCLMTLERPSIQYVRAYFPYEYLQRSLPVIETLSTQGSYLTQYQAVASELPSHFDDSPSCGPETVLKRLLFATVNSVLCATIQFLRFPETS